MCVKKEVFCHSVLEGLCEVQRHCGAVHRRALSIPGQPAGGKTARIQTFSVSRHKCKALLSVPRGCGLNYPHQYKSVNHIVIQDKQHTNDFAVVGVKNKKFACGKHCDQNAI